MRRNKHGSYRLLYATLETAFYVFKPLAYYNTSQIRTITGATVMLANETFALVTSPFVFFYHLLDGPDQEISEHFKSNKKNKGKSRHQKNLEELITDNCNAIRETPHER